MHIPDIKRYSPLPVIYYLLFAFISPSTARATDIQAELDSSDGSSGFTIQNSSGTGEDRIDSNGNMGIGTITANARLIISGGNVGIGTTTPQTAFTVMNGNVGIGTWTAAGGNLIINGTGNVGIGSAWPGVALDVNGKIRVTNFAMTGQSPANGFVLTASDSAGNTTWQAISSAGGGWTQSGALVTTPGTNNVGIGTTTPQAALVVTNGNVGIGTWTAASGTLQVGINTFLVNTSTGNVGIGTTTPAGGLAVMTGNVGIGTWVPGKALDAIGTVRSNVPTTSAAAEFDAASDTAVAVLSVDGSAYGSTLAGLSRNNMVLFEAQNASAFLISTLNSGTAPIVFSPGRAEVARISSAGNLGIGSTAPGTALDVTGTARVTGFQLSTTPTSGYVLTTNSVGVGTWAPSPSGVATSPGGSSPQLQYDNAGSFGGVSGSGVDSNGNVGLGTTTPQGSFVVTNGNVGIGTWAPGNTFQVGTNNLLVTSGANVGIGSTAPGTKLDVQGTARVTAFNLSTTPTNGYVLTSDASGNGTWAASAAGGGWTQSGANVTTAGSNNVGIGTTTPQGAFVVTNGNVGIGTWAPVNLFEVGARNFDITSAGNVGIGTTTPQTLFSVVGGNVGIGTWTAADRLIVKGGNVGIGVTVPSNLLDIEFSDATTYSTSGIINNALRLQNNSATDSDTATIVLVPKDAGGSFGLAAINAISVSGEASAHLAFQLRNNGTYFEAMRIQKDGNVGIGTTVPGTQLDIANSANFEERLIQTTSGVDLRLNAGASTAGTLYTFSNNPLRLGTNNAENMRITTAGNVGIGTTLPGKKLEINIGDATLTGIRVRGSLESLATSTGAADDWVFGAGGATGAVNDFTFYNNAEVMTLQHLGNVGIGSANPGKLLDVAGTVRMTGFNLSTSPTNSYVLTSDANGNGTWAAISSAGGGWTQSGSNISTPGTNNVGIGTTTPQGAFVVTNGNVGIGTWSPGGTTLAVFTSTANGVGIGFQGNHQSRLLLASEFNGTTTAEANVGMIGYGPTTADAISRSIAFGAYNGSWNEIMRLQSGGNVGIGTTSPGSNLSVLGGGSFGSYAVNAAPTGGIITSGNVGIGTVGPTSTLHLYSAGQSEIRMNSSNATGRTWSINAPTGGTSLRFGRSGVADDVTIDNNGNVGIGSVTPGTKLDVQGTVRMTGFNLSTSPTNSYVLTSDANGNGTWAAISSAGGGWTQSGSNISTPGTNNVGIGTTTPQAAFVVTNGNVGIGTWTAGYPLDMSAFSNSVSLRAGTSIQFGNSDFSNGGTGKGMWAASGGGSVGINNYNGPIVFQTSNGGGPTEYMRITNVGNVGIGTTIPNGTLHVRTASAGSVAVDANANSLIVESSGAGGISILNPSASNGNLYFGNPTESSTLILRREATTADFVISGQSSGERMRVTYGGKVGIGVAGPGSPLSVNGGISAGLYSTAVAPSNGMVISGNVGIGTTVPSALLEVGTQKFDVLSGGNVGIGTINPGQILDVSGNLRVNAGSAASPAIVGLTGGNTTGEWFPAANTWAVSTNGVEGMRINSSGNVGIGTTTPQGAFVVTNGNVGIGTWAPTGALQVGRNTLFVNTSTGNVGIGTTTPQGGFTVTTGNLGIGTWAPAQLLDVAGTSRVANFIMSGQSPTNGYVLTATDTAGDTTWQSISSAGGGWTQSGANVYTPGNNNVGIGTTTPQGAFVVTNGNVGIGTWAPGGALIVQTGNVGIGTTGPLAPLHVYTSSTPAIRVENSGTTNSDSLYFYRSGTLEGIVGTAGTATTIISGLAQSDFGFRSDNKNIAFSTDAGSTVQLYLKNGGNVGIGTTVPTRILDIATNANSQQQVNIINSNASGAALAGYQVQNSTANAGGFFGIFGGGFTTSGVNTANAVVVSSQYNAQPLVLAAGDVIKFATGNSATEKVRIDTSGNVGISTVVPGTLLDVNGSIRTRGTSSHYFGDDNNASIAASAATAGDIKFLTNSTEIMRITNGGNVGVGSTAPGTKLDVNGTVRMTGFNLSTAPTNSYVLTSDANGNGTWAAISSAGGGWTQSGSNISTPGTNNVGIGTTTPQAAFVVTNGNVGIGTWTTSDRLIVMGGNVGIGITNPGAKLVTARDTGTGNDHWKLLSATGGTERASIGLATFTSSTANWISVKSQAGIELGTSGDNIRAVIDTSGNVGIGTTVPNGKLNLSAASANAAAQTYNGGIIFDSSDAKTSLQIGNSSGGGWASGTWIQTYNEPATAAGTFALLLNPLGGNVGIGTNSPINNFHIHAASGADVIRMTNSGTGTTSASGMFMGHSDAGLTSFDFWNYANNFIRFATNNTEQVRITAAGNVGIGTTVPGTLLQVGPPPGGYANAVLSVVADSAGRGITLRTSDYVESSAGSRVTTNMGGGSGNTTPTIQVYNAGGNSTGNLSLNGSGGNVGIGSTAPGKLLDVAGTARITGFTMATGASNSYVLTSDANGNGTWAAISSAGGGWTQSGANISTPGTNNVGIGTTTPQAAFVVTNGNVGIGTWTAGGKLEVNVTSSNDNQFISLINNASWTNGKYNNIVWRDNIGNGSVTGAVGMTFDGTSVNFAVTSLYNSGYQTTSFVPFIVKGTGNVGIGTTAPVGLGTGGTAVVLQLSNNSGSNSSGGNFVLSTVRNTSGNYGGIIDFGIHGGSQTEQRGAEIASQITAASSVNISQDLEFITNNAGTLAERMRINSAGNLGIGSTAPGTKLDVAGTARVTAFNLSTTPTNGYVLTSDASGNGTWAASAAGGGWTQSGSNVTTAGSNNVGIGTTTPQGAFVVTNGNVGIGTWAPAAPLDIVAIGDDATPVIRMRQSNNTSYGVDMGIDNNLNGALVFNTVNNGTVAGAVAIDRLNGGVTIGSTYSVSNNSPSNGLIVQGNVGIGTTVPGTKFNVVGGHMELNNTNPALGLWDTQNTIGFYLGNSDDVNNVLTIGKYPAINLTGSKTPYIALTSAGNVGIGTTNPGKVLDVAGDLRMTTSGSGAYFGTDNKASIVGSAATTPDIKFLTNSAEIMRITNGGNVGIGTTTPQAGFIVTSGNVGIGTWTASSGLQVVQSFAVYRTPTAASVTSAGQTIIGVTSTAAARTITLATADTVLGRVVIIKDESGGAATKNITVNTQGGQTIDGAASVVISANYGVLRVYSDGTNWFTF